MKITLRKDLIIVFALEIMIIFTDLTASYVIPSTIRTLIRLGVILLFLCELVRQREKTLFINFFMIVCIIMIYYAGTWSAVTIARNYFLNVLECTCFLIAGLYFLKNNRNINTNSFLFFILVLTCINAVTTLIGVQNYPYAVRELGRGSSYASADKSVVSFYRLKNIVGWPQLYGFVFITMSLSVIFRRTKKLIILILLVITHIAIIASQITIAVILSIGMTIILLWPKAKSKNSYTFQAGLLAAITPVIINIGNIIKWFIELLKTSGFDFIAMKLNDAYTLLFLGHAIGSAESRIKVYDISIQSILRSPVFGNFLSGREPEMIYGFHSELLDMIAFGGIIMLIVLTMFVFEYIRLVKKWGGFMSKEILLIFIAFGIFFSLDPVFLNPPVFMAVFLIPALTKNYLKQIIV